MNPGYKFSVYHAGPTGWVASLTWWDNGHPHGIEKAMGEFPDDFGKMALSALLQFAEKSDQQQKDQIQ